MGMVHDKDERNIDTSFMLDDTTGRIEIKRWSVLFIFWANSLLSCSKWHLCNVNVLSPFYSPVGDKHLFCFTYIYKIGGGVIYITEGSRSWSNF